MKSINIKEILANLLNPYNTNGFRLVFIILLFLIGSTAYSQKESSIKKEIDSLGHCYKLDSADLQKIINSSSDGIYWVCYIEGQKGYWDLKKADNTTLTDNVREAAYNSGIKYCLQAIRQCDSSIKLINEGNSLIPHIKMVKAEAIFNIAHRGELVYEKDYNLADSLFEADTIYLRTIDTTQIFLSNDVSSFFNHKKLVNDWLTIYDYALTNQGKLYQYVNLFYLAIDNFRITLHLSIRMLNYDSANIVGWETRLSWAYQNLGEVYLQLEISDTSLKAQQIFADSALRNMKQCFLLKNRIFHQSNDKITDDYINGLNTLVLAYIERDSLGKAQNLLKYSLSLLGNRGERMQVDKLGLKIAEVHFLNGKLFIKQDKSDSAISSFLESYRILDTLKDKSILFYELKRNILFEVKNFYIREGDYSNAIKYQLKYDSALNNINISPVTKLAFYAKNRNRANLYLSKLNSDLNNKNAELKHKTILLIVGVIIIIIFILIFLYLIIRQWNLVKIQNTMLLSIYHDLRTPSAKIRNEAKVAKNISVNDKKDEALNKIIRASSYLENLADTLLLYEKVNGIKIENNNEHALFRCCEEAIGMVKSAKGTNIEIINEIDPDLYCKFDFSHIIRVFMNLISNAVKAVNARGDESSDFEGKIVITSSKVTNNDILICVHDNGFGFSSKHYGNMDSPNSIGIGLKYCKFVLSAHGSSLDLKKSDVLDGACACFILKGRERQKNNEHIRELSPITPILNDADSTYLRSKLANIHELPFYHYSALHTKLAMAYDEATKPCKDAIDILLDHLVNQREKAFRDFIEKL